MSRGLGALQRTILDTLDAAKISRVRYVGQEYHRDRPDWDRVNVRGYACLLAPQVYDLRASLAYLLQQRGLPRWHHDRLQPAFARAVRGLVQTGALEVLTRVPMLLVEGLHGKDLPPDFPRGVMGIWTTADGRYYYIEVSDRQRRFVVRAGAPHTHARED